MLVSSVGFRHFMPAPLGRLPPIAGDMTESVVKLPRANVDKFDHQILALLRADARAPVSQIAREVSLSRSAVAERIRQLEVAGVIQGYHARVADPEQPSIKAFLELFYKDSRCEIYAERMRAFPEVRQCCGISGETDMLVQVETSSMARLAEIRGEIERFPGMQRVKTHMVVKEWAM